MRRRGFLDALLNVGPDEAGTYRGLSGSERQPRLAQLMNQGGSGTALDASVVKQLADKLPTPPKHGYEKWRTQTSPSPSLPLRDPGMSFPSAPQNRIEDDRTRHPQGDPQPQSPDFVDQAPQMAQASRASLAQQMQQPQQPAQPAPDAYAPLKQQIQQMQGQYDQLNQPQPPLSLLKKIALGVSAPFGGLQAYVAERDRQQAMQGQNQRNLLQEIQAGQRTLGSEESADRRMAQQQQMAQPEHTDTDQGPIQYNRQTGQWEPITLGGQRVGPKVTKPDTPEQQYMDYAASHGMSLPDAIKQYTALTQKPDQKPDTPEQQYIDDAQKRGMSLPQAVRAYSRDTQKPERPEKPQRELAVGPDGKVFELTPGMTVPEGTRSVRSDLTPAKPTADEQRRADLANNMSENLNQLEDIVNRRPDLFGSIAGRYTQLRQWGGTSDSDVAKLKAIKEYLGMASVGAHSMRNAQHVGAAADAVMSGFLNSPEATKAAIQTARSSVATFQQDIDRAKGGGSQQSQSAGGGTRTYQGATYSRQPDGTWKRQ